MAVQRAKEFLANDKKVLILTHSRTLPVDIRKLNILIMKNLENFALSQHFNLHLI